MEPRAIAIYCGESSNAARTINIQTNLSLKHRNTFGLETEAEYFCSVTNLPELEQALQFARDKALKVQVLGGGSNLLLPPKIAGLVLSPDLMGIEVTEAKVKVAAGENWHRFVQKTLDLGLSGLENLALIPGHVGAAPIQNIGAYGVELCERVLGVDALNLKSGDLVRFDNNECQFGYRDSLFKTAEKDQWVITHLTLNLDADFKPRLEYQGVVEQVTSLTPTAQQVFDAICRIRQSKLPDPTVVGNVGSFFKNPMVDSGFAERLKHRHKRLPVYSVADSDQVKLSAAFLIDELGFKGISRGGASVSFQHALVIQNDGGASFDDVRALSSFIIQEVQQRFDIELEVEPRFLV